MATRIGGALDIAKDIALGVLPTALALGAFGVARDRNLTAVQSAVIGALGALAGETARTYLAGNDGAVSGLTIERLGYNTPYAWRTMAAPRQRVSGLTLERVGMCGPYGCA